MSARAAFAHKGGLHVSAVEKDPRILRACRPGAGRQRSAISSCRTRPGAPTSWRGCARSASTVDAKHPKLDALLDEVKAREFEGYAYDGAEASFELLARRTLGSVPDYFRVQRFRVHGRAALEREGRARHRVRGDRQRRRSAAERSWRSPKGNGPVNALDDGAAQGADRRLSRARRTSASSTTRCAS